MTVDVQDAYEGIWNHLCENSSANGEPTPLGFSSKSDGEEDWQKVPPGNLSKQLPPRKSNNSEPPYKNNKRGKPWQIQQAGNSLRILCEGILGLP